MRRRGVKQMIFGICVLFLLYYLFIIADTHPVMKELEEIEVGEKIYEIDENILSVFSYHEGYKYKVVDIRRYFTWCWNNKGKIWITNKVIPWNGGTIEPSREYQILKIEKIKGKWEVVGRSIEP